MLAKIRVHIECLFGRMWLLWSLLRHPYPYDHSKIDTDFENMLLLTNEHIRWTKPLEEHDHIFYCSTLQTRRKKNEEKQKKIKEAKEKYARSKRRRLESWASRE
jgi:hypothetical protein